MELRTNVYNVTSKKFNDQKLKQLTEEQLRELAKQNEIKAFQSYGNRLLDYRGSFVSTTYLVQKRCAKKLKFTDGVAIPAKDEGGVLTRLMKKLQRLLVTKDVPGNEQYRD